MNHKSSVPVLIFGASRGTGLLLARRLRRQGVDVYAMLRPQSDGTELHDLGVHVLQGDALEPDDVARAFSAAGAGCDVVSTLGGRQNGRYVDHEGNVHVADQAAQVGIHRFVLVTSIGCGDMAPYRSAKAVEAFGDSVDAKTRAENHLRRVLPSATIVRPGGLLSDNATGQGWLCEDPQVHGFITRADLAELIDRVLRDPATRGRTLAAVDAQRLRCVNPVTPFSLSPARDTPDGASVTGVA
ncbi:SDR family oxidoreductase [Achromobacter sp. F4_2707]|uniref:SDR family oxidoreductase n=1 Tax=Achromobacter sp. F4_2707 TaxID=3114286 RepID=UPI0039C73604